jgi:membrane associated rhomboid family serine protease
VLGGRTPRSATPVVTYVLIALCVVSFALQLGVGAEWSQRWAFSAATGVVEPWRFLTAAFLHSTGGVVHILFNMWALWITGQALEPLLGRGRFVALAVLSAVGGSVGWLVLAGTPADGSWYAGVVGASGMVFGLFGALIPVLRRLGGSARQIVVLLAINGVLGFVIPGIAWQAHLGGLVTGLALGAGFARASRSRQAFVGWALPAVVGVVLVAAAVWRYTSVGWY